MARKRMIDPNIWKDPNFAKLTDPEKVLFIGIISNADDEGRIIATPEALKADIFPYDHKKPASVVKKLRESVVTELKNVCLYKNDEVEYIALLRWNRYQKPKHLKASILPKPPIEPYLETETVGETSSPPVSPPAIPPQSPPVSRPSIGQSSQGKDSIAKVSTVQGDFKEFFGNEHDLTDCLTTALTENISAGRARAGTQEGMNQDTSVRMNWGIQILKKCWKDCLGEEMPTAIFEGARHALRDIPIPIVAKAFAKAMSYQCGKHKSWKYIQKIIDQEMQKGKP